MSAAYWRQLALNAIAEAVAALPADADEKTKRAAISKNYPLYERSHYPYLIWRQEVQKYFGTYKPSPSNAASRKRYNERTSLNAAKRRIEEYEKATGKQFPGGKNA